VTVPILPGDTAETLAERVHAAEHRLLVDTLAELCPPSRTRLTDGAEP
jgi:folate-dependent phosphoribosylglycinamide formyltransferase PurN